MQELERALLLKPFWANRILCNNKTWEIRSRATKIRGRIGIIASGTGLILGECEIVDCIKLTKELYENNYNKHQINCHYCLLPNSYQNGYAWVIKEGSAIIYDEPIPYKHPQGAVIWVNLKK